MESPRGIDEQQVAALCAIGRDRVEHDRRRVRALLVPHHRHARAVCPFAELFRRRRAEGVRRRDHGLPSGLRVLVCDLADRGRLADAVHADDQKNRGSLVAHKRFVGAHRVRDQPFQRLPCIRALGELVRLDLCAQPVQQPFRRLHAHISKDHGFFELLIEVVVDAVLVEQGRKPVVRFVQAFLQPGKPALFLFVLFHYAVSPNLAETILDMPFSSIATPYSVSQTSMLPLRCVMMMNCVSSEYALR